VDILEVARRWRPLWLLLASTGLRIGEARALAWADTNLAAGTLRVTKATQAIEGREVVTTPKTLAGVRTLSLAPQAVEALRQWKHRQALELMRLGKRNSAITLKVYAHALVGDDRAADITARVLDGQAAVEARRSLDRR
jgi:integrase